MVIWFDMDGTFVDLYGVENWLEMLVAHNEKPYEIAKPLFRMNTFARELNKLKKMGYEIGVISWLSKNSNNEYDNRVKTAKENWLKTHLKSVEFNYVEIVPYGTPKNEGRNGILFDDEKPNRDSWNGTAYNAENIMEILKGLEI